MRIDPHSPTWLVIEAHLNQRVADIRARLEGDQAEDSSIRLRASLRECKSLLELAGDRTPLVESDIEIPG